MYPRLCLPIIWYVYIYLVVQNLYIDISLQATHAHCFLLQLCVPPPYWCGYEFSVEMMSMGHTNFLVKMQLSWAQDPMSSPKD